MTDYFALLNQPQQPWLDEQSLTSAYHAKALLIHPDTTARANDSHAFATLNEAYQTLQDPKRRLHHLLSLHGHAPEAARQTIPGELADLFSTMISLIQKTDAVLESARSATNALTRSLQKPALLEIDLQIAAQLLRLSKLYDGTIEELKARNSAWIADAAQEIDRLTQLYFRFAYLGRWISQVEERHVALSLC